MMSVRQPRDGQQTRGSDWLDVVTGRIGKVSALVAAVGGLVVLVLNQSAQIHEKLVAMKILSAPPCVEISRVVIPPTVRYSEWDNMRIKVEGRNNCDEPLGLYVTFLPRTAENPSFRLRVPHEDDPDCSGTPAVLEPKCWDPKKPVAIRKGEWQWEMLPPPLESLSDSWSTDTISVSWEVRDYDDPQRPIATDSAQIAVTND
jgi:hypothetical protein